MQLCVGMDSKVLHIFREENNVFREENNCVDKMAILG